MYRQENVRKEVYIWGNNGTIIGVHVQNGTIFMKKYWEGRARSSALSSEGGLSRIYEPVLYMRPID